MAGVVEGAMIGVSNGYAGEHEEVITMSPAAFHTFIIKQTKKRCLLFYIRCPRYAAIGTPIIAHASRWRLASLT